MTSKESTTVFFVSDRLPVAVVLTLEKLDNTGRMRSHVSVRSTSPQPIESMLEIQTVWQEWISSCVDGQSPALPKGWRVSDEGREAPTPRPSNHHH